MVHYSTNNKDHPSQNEHAKMTCLNWQNDFLMFIQRGFFFVAFFNQRNHVFLVIGL
jgi:hypothetical protein